MYDPPSGIVFHESTIFATSCITYLRGTSYEIPHFAVNALQAMSHFGLSLSTVKSGIKLVKSQ